MKKIILANDGISPEGISHLESHGFEVRTDKVDQDDLVEYLNSHEIPVLLVRSATKVRKQLLDACPNLKFIGRGGVGMDNIDVDIARNMGKIVENTPNASSNSVAELVLAHYMAISRSLPQSYCAMPEKGHTEFKALKKAYSKGSELSGKTMGVLGFGRIAKQTISKALGMGMHVKVYNRTPRKETLQIELPNGVSFDHTIQTETLEHVLKGSDVVSLHIPSSETPLIGKQELSWMPKHSVLINTARGNSVDEAALLESLENSEISAAALDVFENEPAPLEALLSHARVFSSPHIGGQTLEAQARIGTEMAEKIVAWYA